MPLDMRQENKGVDGHASLRAESNPAMKTNERAFSSLLLKFSVIRVCCLYKKKGKRMLVGI